MPIPEVIAIVTGIKGTIDIAKGLKSAYDAHTITQAQTEILEKLFDLRVDALSLQEKTSALLSEKEELAKKLTEYKKWSETETEYSLGEVGPGIFVFVYQKPADSPKPIHWLCTRCWEERVKSILQSDYDHESAASYTCPRCKTAYAWEKPNAPRFNPIVSRRDDYRF